jgi:hypothetical protein
VPRGRKLPNLTLLASTIEGSYPPEALPPLDSDGRVVRLRLTDLWLDHQPREIVPEAALQELIAADRAQPAALLSLLQQAAPADPYYADVQDKLNGLARSIAAEGVLQPIQVVRRAERWLVRDGHRRCLASLLAGIDAVPAVAVEEPGELEAVAHALIVNVQREDLTALEKGAALFRLALLVARRLAEAAGEPPPFTLETLLASAPTTADADLLVATDADGSTPGGPSPVAGRPRALAAQVRERVCAMVGLQPRTYYRLLALNRLTPEARADGRSLTENQLRPIVSLPPDGQAEVVAFARRRGLSAKEIASLAQVVRAGDRDAVRRVMARLAREEAGRQRTAVSWEPLLHAVPRDIWARCQALRAELAALPPAHRRARLDALWEQDRLVLAFHDELQQIFAAYDYRGPATPSEPAE